MIDLDKAEVLLVDSETNEVLLTAKPLRTISIKQLPKKKFKVEIKTEDGQVFTRYTDYFDISDDGKTIHMEGMKAEGCEINFDKTSLL
ncbi:hypothetical protein [Lysinibacillus sp. NPDC086135]|uniref:hypothetical protein n=1 Tax=Lysinibacillus sp. NPDC086135 TaxID=3364130 RepID=UPI00380CECC1